MNEQERLMLIGEQTLLEEERRQVQATRHALQSRLLNVYNDITSTHGVPTWMEAAQKTLGELHKAQTRLVELDVRIAAIKKLTGR